MTWRYGGRMIKKAKECGYDKCGIIPVEQMAGYADSLDEREKRLPETKEFYDKFRPLPTRADNTHGSSR